jgi:hypothetical protein
LGFGADQKTIDNTNGSFSGAAKAFFIKEPQLIKVFGNAKALMVIRPNGYIGMTGGPDDQIAVKEYLEKFLSPDELK